METSPLRRGEPAVPLPGDAVPSVMPGAMHCGCTRATHQTIFESALAKPVPVKLVESLCRGGASRHFVAEIG